MKKILAIVLALALIVTAFASCTPKKPATDDPGATAAPGSETADGSTPLVVGYSNF